MSLWLQPSSTSGEDFLFRAGGPSGDTNGYLDNVMIEVVRVGDELRVLWEESGAVDVSHVTNDLALRAGQTYHIIVSVEESPVSSSYRDVALYVTTPDEGRVFEEVWLDRARVVAGDVSTMIVAVGGDPGSASTSGADGSIDEVTLFSTALGSVEAWELTQSMLGGQLCGAFESACGDHSLSTSGVVSAWFFDEGSPTIIREMENRYPLSLEGSAYPGVTGGLVGSTPGTRGARSFSSTATKMGRALDVPLRDELASSDYSLSFWVQTPGSGYIVSAGGPIGDTGGSLYNVLLEIYVGTDGRLRVLWEHASGANQSFTTNAAVAFGAPHHVLLTVTPTSGSQADATLQVRDAAYNVVIDESWTGLTRPIAGDIAHARWIVGGRNSSTGGFSGVLDNMTLFAASLSTEQSAALYEAERLGVAAAWQLHEHSSDDPAHDAMGRYTLPIYGTALLPVTESLFTHDVRHTGARELGAAPLARIGGNEHLSDLFADFSYTMMASFQPALVSGHRILAIYAGAVGDGYGGRDNYQMELAQSGDEIRVFWEYGTGSNVSMLTGDLNLVAGRVYSLAVTVYDATNPAYRNVLLEVADWTTSTSRQFQWTNKVRAARGTTSRMRLSLGGHPDGSFFHGVLDEVYVFAPAATTRTVHSIWNEYGWDQVLCAPGFTSPVLSNSSQQQSLLLQSSDELAGPAAGTAEGRHQGGEQPINSGPSSSAGEPLEPAALEDDESDDIAFGAPGHYFDAP